MFSGAAESTVSRRFRKMLCRRFHRLRPASGREMYGRGTGVRLINIDMERLMVFLFRFPAQIIFNHFQLQSLAAQAHELGCFRDVAV